MRRDVFVWAARDGKRGNPAVGVQCRRRREAQGCLGARSIAVCVWRAPTSGDTSSRRELALARPNELCRPAPHDTRARLAGATLDTDDSLRSRRVAHGHQVCALRTAALFLARRRALGVLPWRGSRSRGGSAVISCWIQNAGANMDATSGCLSTRHSLDSFRKCVPEPADGLHFRVAHPGKVNKLCYKVRPSKVACGYHAFFWR